MTLLGPYLVACALLAVAGLGKGLRPSDSVRALAALVPGAPPSVLRLVVRTLALAEAGLGVAAVVTPHRLLAGTVALSYLAFAAFVAYVRLRHGVLASCGCFSTPDTPATWPHVAANLALAAAAAAVSASGSPDTLFTVLARQPADGLPLIAACATGTWLALLTLVGLPRLSAVRRTAAVAVPHGRRR
ncbi:MAG TPA: MauE/DoxX family redox-associated membrane protein [Acidimicrobiales bacterium]